MLRSLGLLDSDVLPIEILFEIPSFGESLCDFPPSLGSAGKVDLPLELPMNGVTGVLHYTTHSVVGNAERPLQITVAKKSRVTTSRCSGAMGARPLLKNNVKL